jgi:hypothetical protein
MNRVIHGKAAMAFEKYDKSMNVGVVVDFDDAIVDIRLCGRAIEEGLSVSESGSASPLVRATNSKMNGIRFGPPRRI